MPLSNRLSSDLSQITTSHILRLNIEGLLAANHNIVTSVAKQLSDITASTVESCLSTKLVENNVYVQLMITQLPG